MSVDWSRPIEAVHEDGRVAHAKVIWRKSPDVDGDYWLEIDGLTGFIAGDDDDRVAPICHGWRIRNVVPAERTDIATVAASKPDALVERMVACLERAASGYHVQPEARAIVSELPAEVDAPNLETTIQAAMDSGNDVTAYEIAQAVEDFLATRRAEEE